MDSIMDMQLGNFTLKFVLIIIGVWFLVMLTALIVSAAKGKVNKYGQYWLTKIPTFAFLVIQALVSVGVMIFGMLIKPELIDWRTGTMSAELISIVLVIFECVAFVVFLFSYKLLTRFKPEKPSRCLSAVSIPAIIIMFVGLQYVIEFLLSLVATFLPSVMENYNSLMQNSGLGEVSALTVIAVVIIGPIVEELVFRGMTLRLALKFSNGKFWIANIIQAFMFGLAHMNIVQGIYAFLLGMFLGYIYKKYCSLYASMAGHIAFNLFGSVGSSLLIKLVGEEPALWVEGLIGLGGIVLAAIGIFMISKDSKCRIREDNFRHLLDVRNKKGELIQRPGCSEG